MQVTWTLVRWVHTILSSNRRTPIAKLHPESSRPALPTTLFGDRRKPRHNPAPSDAHPPIAQHVEQVRLHQGSEGGALPVLPDWRAQRCDKVRCLRGIPGHSPGPTTPSTTNTAQPCIHADCGINRSFLTRAYPTMKKNNPNTPILLREAAGTSPKIYARYGAFSPRFFWLRAPSICYMTAPMLITRCYRAWKGEEPVVRRLNRQAD